ncbi:MAG: hypothetical protein RIF33_08860 [Cyclobacteriaceae bacterium]
MHDLNKGTKNSDAFRKKLMQLRARRSEIENEMVSEAERPEVQKYYDAIAEADEAVDIILLS